MRVTKHEHACLRLDSEGKTLLIDPGSFTLPLDDLGTLVGVVLTHEHPDHWTPAQLDAIRSQAPSVPVFGPGGRVAAARTLRDGVGGRAEVEAGLAAAARAERSLGPADADDTDRLVAAYLA